VGAAGKTDSRESAAFVTPCSDAAVTRERRIRRNSRTTAWQTIRELVRTLPGSEEGTSYGTPAFKVSGKLFVRLHQDGDSIVVRIDIADRAARMQGDPSAFYITDHYRAYPWILVRLAAVRRDDLANVLEEAWRLRAPKRLLAEYRSESWTCSIPADPFANTFRW
jgi:hypothetical protein